MKKLLSKKNISGYAFMAMTVAVTVTIVLLAVILVFYNQQANYALKHEEKKQEALYIAEAGVSNYLFNLNKDENYAQTTTHPAEISWQDFDKGQYMLNVNTVDDNTIDVTVNARLKIEKNNYKLRKIKVRLEKRSFLKYMYFTDMETMEGIGSRIWFITGDVIKGPLHSNDNISISGSPVFQAKVTTAKTFYPGPGSAVFEQGYEENVQPLELPTTNSQLKTWGQSAEGYYYYGKTDIILNSNGTVDISNADSVHSTGPIGVGLALPINGVIYIDGATGTKYASTSGNAFVEGTLKGQLTIATKDSVYITGDLLYANDNEDMLGLIAENYIYINHYDNHGHDVAPNIITIKAALAALNHSFTFEDFRYGPAKDTIVITGAVTQRFRGPVGTFWGSTIYSGYSKDYNYDQRMQYQEPPHFIEPLNKGFYISNWEEQ